MGAKPGTKYKKFPKDYRDETADYVIAAGRPVREVARELGLADVPRLRQRFFMRVVMRRNSQSQRAPRRIIRRY